MGNNYTTNEEITIRQNGEKLCNNIGKNYTTKLGITIQQNGE